MADHPCWNCEIRKYYARRFDLHIWAEDCPYVCERLEKWKEMVRKND